MLNCGHVHIFWGKGSHLHQVSKEQLIQTRLKSTTLRKEGRGGGETETGRGEGKGGGGGVDFVYLFRSL